MIKPLWAVAGVALLGTAGVAGAVIVASTGGEEEVLQEAGTLTPTRQAESPTPTSTPPAPGTTNPLPTPTTTISSTPSGWPTYADPDGRFTLSYPPSWFLDDGATSKNRPPGYLTTHFFSYEPGSIAPGGKFPRGAIKIDLGVFRREEGLDPDCAAPPPPESTPALLGGVAGWRKVVNYEPNYEVSEDGLTYNDTLVALYDGFCFVISGYFAQDERGNSDFDRLISSFRFAN